MPDIKEVLELFSNADDDIRDRAVRFLRNSIRPVETQDRPDDTKPEILDLVRS